MSTDTSQHRFVVVTPNFNMGSYLMETIESVLRNLREGDQYFIIDGGSTDNSIEVIRRYEDRLAGWVSEKDEGYSHAIAKGFAMGNGQFQYWVNSGDLILPGSLDAAREILLQGEVDLIFGDDVNIDEDGCIIQISNGYTKNLKLMMLNGGWTPLQDACFWKTSLYEKVGGLDINLKNAADFDLFLRMVVSGKVKYIPQIFSAFRKHQNQKSIKNQIAYRKEREICRKREINKIYRGRIIDSALLTIFYWIKVHWRARFQDKKSNSDQFKGKFINEINFR